MKKYKALVWESDYIPGAVEPIDGAVIRKAYKPGRRSPWSYTGRFISGALDKPYLYRSVYIWTEDAFDDFNSDLELYRDKALEAASKAKSIVAKWSVITNATGFAGYLISFLPVAGNALGAVLSTINVKTSIVAMCIGNEVELNSDLIVRQYERMIGALDKRSSGTIVSFKESVTVKSYTNDSKYTKRHYQKIKFGPYVDYLTNKTYSIVERGLSDPYPSYDVYLRHGVDEQITSDCQGTFTAYEDYRDIKPLVQMED